MINKEIIMGKPLDQKQEQTLKQIIKAVDQLPTLPSVITQLMSLSISDERFFEKVKQLAEQDPTFTARLIKIANSSAFPSITPVTSISHAVSRIGSRRIKELITTFAIAKIFVPSNKSERDLWAHSIQVAVASQLIASIATELNINPEEAYLAGLLHDIGRFVLFNIIPDGPEKIDKQEWDNPEHLLEAEKKVCGFNHAALGGFAAKRWGLPESISDVIGRHHCHDHSILNQQEIKKGNLIKIIQMGDCLSVMLMKEPDILYVTPKELQAQIESKCIHESWHVPPISSLLLQSEVLNIHHKSSNTFIGLGLCVDE